MEQHLVSRLRRILPAAALLLAVSCSKDEADIVQLPTPQTIEATPTETSLQLEWAAVEKASRYELQAGSETGYAFETVVEQPRYELTGLEPYSEYAVRVRAIVSAGNYSDSEWSAWTTFRTLDRTVAEAFDGGTGSEEEPYRISRPSHLALLAQVVNNRENGYCEPGVHYVLTGDLDLSRYDNWTPIGLGPEDGRYPYENPDRAFQGVFDGDGHTISGLKVELTGETTFTSAGLFGVNDGTIRNLNVAGSVHATTTAVDKSYVLAGGITGFNIIAYEDSMNTRPGSGAIESCTFRGSVSASCGPDTQGEADAGGICGMAESGNIDYCNVTLGDGDLLATAGGTVSMAGGIVGAMNGGRISHCSFNGTGSLECTFTAAPEGYYVYAQAGGIAGSVTDAAIESCNVEFGGALRIPDGGAANCNAGLVCGNSGGLGHRLLCEILGQRHDPQRRLDQLRRHRRHTLGKQPGSHDARHGRAGRHADDRADGQLLRCQRRRHLRLGCECRHLGLQGLDLRRDRHHVAGQRCHDQRQCGRHRGSGQPSHGRLPRRVGRGRQRPDHLRPHELRRRGRHGALG